MKFGNMRTYLKNCVKKIYKCKTKQGHHLRGAGGQSPPRKKKEERRKKRKKEEKERTEL